ncbi:MAG: hypothetical protein CVV21_04860 [Candidatus Goldiibacteriota bacterium HGW-Goldbacteria-1]|jgi:hypothetical protein|nr:MAG: hypothetical protein CVV21_04860 [Candidatus Goldiibacteriota bacterium HGW-Goldbacteria-1]
MDMIIVVCVIVTTAAITTGTVFFIITMVQVRKTAKELEGVAEIINMAAPFVELMFLGKGIVAKIVKKISGFLGKTAKGGKK